MAEKLLDSRRGRALVFGAGGGAVVLMTILGLVIRSPESNGIVPAEGVAAAAPSIEETVAAPSSPASANIPSAIPSTTAVKPPSPTVQLTLRVFPAVGATVTMGKTRLGTIAPRGVLVLERRRDSGPLDLVIRAGGYVPLHTRAYTFDSNTVEVRLTPLDKKDTIYGYRQPLPPEEDPAAAASASTRQWVPLSALLGGAAPSAAPPASSAPAATPVPLGSSSLPR